MQWIAGYQETLGEFGVEEGDVLFPSHHQAGTGLLIDKYVERTVATLSSWLLNIVEVRGEGRRGWGAWMGRLNGCGLGRTLGIGRQDVANGA